MIYRSNSNCALFRPVDDSKSPRISSLTKLEVVAPRSRRTVSNTGQKPTTCFTYQQLLLKWFLQAQSIRNTFFLRIQKLSITTILSNFRLLHVLYQNRFSRRVSPISVLSIPFHPNPKLRSLNRLPARMACTKLQSRFPKDVKCTHAINTCQTSCSSSQEARLSPTTSLDIASDQETSPGLQIQHP